MKTTKTNTTTGACWMVRLPSISGGYLVYSECQTQTEAEQVASYLRSLGMAPSVHYCD